MEEQNFLRGGGGGGVGLNFLGGGGRGWGRKFLEGEGWWRKRENFLRGRGVGDFQFQRGGVVEDP